MVENNGKMKIGLRIVTLGIAIAGGNALFVGARNPEGRKSMKSSIWVGNTSPR